MFTSNSRKKLLLKCVCFATLLVMILNILNTYYLQRNICDNDRTAKFKDIAPGIVISNTGSSHGLYGFNYEELGEEYNCFNFALESQRLSYDYRIVSNYSDYLAENGIMFITVSFFSIYGMDETEIDGFESKNQRYYKILPPGKIKEYNWKEDIKQHILPVINDEELLKTFVEGKTTGEAFQKIWYLNAAEAEDLEGDAQSAYERHYVKNNIIETKKINAADYEALINLILLCKDKNVEPILITTPLMPEYKNKIRRDFLDDFYEKIEGIVINMGVSYYDYSSDERFDECPWLFMNVDHLNKEGALEFTNILEEEIISERYLR